MTDNEQYINLSLESQQKLEEWGNLEKQVEQMEKEKKRLDQERLDLSKELALTKRKSIQTKEEFFAMDAKRRKILKKMNDDLQAEKKKNDEIQTEMRRKLQDEMWSKQAFQTGISDDDLLAVPETIPPTSTSPPDTHTEATTSTKSDANSTTTTIKTSSSDNTSTTPSQNQDPKPLTPTSIPATPKKQIQQHNTDPAIKSTDNSKTKQSATHTITTPKKQPRDNTKKQPQDDTNSPPKTIHLTPIKPGTINAIEETESMNNDETNASEEMEDAEPIQ